MMKDLVTLELIRESLIAVVHEMRANIIHASFSSIIYEGHDFSCAILTPDGRQIAQSNDDHPIHIFAVPYSTREVARTFAGDIHEGDIFLHNDPYTGGTHLNDVLMLTPVFVGGHLVMFAAARCHWGDVGGMAAGSLSGQVREIIQEGMRVVPTRIAEKGVLNEAFLDLLFNNMRNPQERRGDFNTMLGTGRKAAVHVGRLFRRFGPETMLGGIEELIRRSDRQMRTRIAALPDGDYFAEGFVESDGHGGGPLVGRLKLSIRGEELIADLTGSSPQTNGPTNFGPAMARNSVGTMVKSFLDPRTPINHGSFMPIKVIAPEGSFLNARAPVPCGGMAEVKYMLDGVVAAALGQAVQEFMVGDNRGSANHTTIAGPNRRGDGMFILYEYPAGGTGASHGTDGSNVLRCFGEGDFNSIQSSEVVEFSNPIRIERCELREGSCGDGEFRGGLGLRRDYRLLSPQGTLSLLTDHNLIPPYGVKGGMSGGGNRFVVVRDGQEVQPSAVPGKVSDFPLKAGDIVRAETAGGGGWGDPLTRDPERVARDSRLGYITQAQAKARFGVVLLDGFKVDAGATRKEREQLRAQRVELALQLANTEEPKTARRMVPLAPQVAQRLGIRDGDMVELTNRRGPSVRGWARVSDEADGGSLRLGAAALALLDGKPGERIEVRVLRAMPL
ncbi:MAG: hypothetical protein EXQ96_02575 [Alphaproteobacteria bacterium]|nr:hypothetical protein [Alphaproteobacteria bacterium]